MKTKNGILILALIICSVGAFAQIDTSKSSKSRVKSKPTYTTTPTPNNKVAPKNRSQSPDTMKTPKSMHSKSYKANRDSTKKSK
jgi:hypothetical protein